MADSGTGSKSKSRVPLVAAAEMRDLETRVKTCQLCRLAKTRTNAVPGEGDFRAEVMFIGEGPGYHEDRQGRPFVGAAGQFLDELLSIAGLSRESAFVANVVKCRPPGNRDPNPDEIAACAPYLEQQIALINPRVIVTLGRFSMSKFFPGERISQIHGQARVVDGRMCVAMYHPAAGLHQASLADVIRKDFRLLPVYVEQARKMFSPPPAEVEERIVEAEAAREFVVHDPDTGAVREPVAESVAEPPAPAVIATSDADDLFAEESVVREQPASYAPAAEMEVTSNGASHDKAPVKAEAAPKKVARKKEPKKAEYEQLSFLDM
jgi:uracil-DNA glycosylase